MFVVVHSAEFLIQSNMGGTGFMRKKCEGENNIDCKCNCHSKEKKLICIYRCVPINQKCDDTTTQTYFYVSSDSNIKNPSGTITIINTSKSCTMQVAITKSSIDHV